MAPRAVAAPAVAPHFLWWDRKLSAASEGEGRVGSSDAQNPPRAESWGKPRPREPGGPPTCTLFPIIPQAASAPPFSTQLYFKPLSSPPYHGERRGAGREEGSQPLSVAGERKALTGWFRNVPGWACWRSWVSHTSPVSPWSPLNPAACRPVPGRQQGWLRQLPSCTCEIWVELWAAGFRSAWL